MSERYRKIEVKIHGDERVRRLSKPTPNGRDCWFYLLCARESCIIPGVLPAGAGAMSDSLRWSRRGFLRAFGEVEGEGLALADWDAGLVWIPNALKYNPAPNPNVITSWAETWEHEVPQCALKRQIWRALREHCTERGPSFLAAFLAACPEPPAAREDNSADIQTLTTSPIAAQAVETTTLPPTAEVDIAADSPMGSIGDGVNPSGNGSRNGSPNPSRNQVAVSSEQLRDDLGGSVPPSLPAQRVGDPQRPVLELEPPSAGKRKPKPSEQQELQAELEQLRLERVREAGLPDVPERYPVARLNTMLKPLLEVDPSVRRDAFMLFLAEERYGGLDPPWPTWAFASDSAKFISRAARGAA